MRIDLRIARAQIAQPTLLCCKTVIGKGSPNKQGLEASHGAPLGADEILLTRQALKWDHEAFELPDDIYEGWDCTVKGQAVQQSWESEFDAYKDAYPELASELLRRVNGDLPANFETQAQEFIKTCQDNPENIATRKASQNSINALQPLLPELLGGSADLAGSNLTWFKNAKALEDDAAGNYIHYGVREFGMTAIANGIALYGGFIPYVATFLMFMEYARNAVRMSALMKQRVINVYTHDSIGLGEDGPTHQPIEHFAALRAIPNLHVIRPADANETAACWIEILKRNKPAGILLSRQNLPVMPLNAAGVSKGAYAVKAVANPKVSIIATGSEVSVAMKAAEKLEADGISTQVVSAPCLEWFAEQDGAYRESLLPKSAIKVSIEAGIAQGWREYVGDNGVTISLDHFGASASAAKLFEEFGFGTDAVVAKIKAAL